MFIHTNHICISSVQPCGAQNFLILAKYDIVLAADCFVCGDFSLSSALDTVHSVLIHWQLNTYSPISPHVIQWCCSVVVNALDSQPKGRGFRSHIYTFFKLINTNTCFTYSADFLTLFADSDFLLFIRIATSDKFLHCVSTVHTHLMLICLSVCICLFLSVSCLLLSPPVSFSHSSLLLSSPFSLFSLPTLSEIKHLNRTVFSNWCFFKFIWATSNFNILVIHMILFQVLAFNAFKVSWFIWSTCDCSSTYTYKCFSHLNTNFCLSAYSLICTSSVLMPVPVKELDTYKSSFQHNFICFTFIIKFISITL